ncbi:MAG TPA: hypothetical protein VFF69_05275 [Phycisphaerales bacterium]|nr:hypothetical protein [Phycisphaerales bacterium]
MEPAEFARMIWDKFGSDGPFEPGAYYDPDGDCLEFFLTNEAFKGERLDKWVTVYRGRRSGKIVGSMIKNVRELLERNPGLAIQIRSKPIQIWQFLRAPQFSATSEVAVRVYEEMIEETRVSEIHAPTEMVCA